MTGQPHAVQNSGQACQPGVGKGVDDKGVPEKGGAQEGPFTLYVLRREPFQMVLPRAPQKAVNGPAVAIDLHSSML